MFLFIESGGEIMYLFLSIIIIFMFCTIITKMFMKDNKHDLEIQIGKFKFSMKKHDKE